MRKHTILAALILFLSISCTGSDEIEEGYLDVNGTTLYYKTFGSGEPIVVL
ncbi:MAG: hypothetical protein GY863_14995, partial [bacterium]|nr:hypothetical protein [bacterium]